MCLNSSVLRQIQLSFLGSGSGFAWVEKDKQLCQTVNVHYQMIMKFGMQVEWSEYNVSPILCICIDNCTDVVDDDMLPWCLYVYKKGQNYFTY